MTTTPTPTVGSRIRVTQRHEASGEVLIVEGVPDYTRGTYVQFPSGSAFELDPREGWTVTVEELEPPAPVLPDEPPLWDAVQVTTDDYPEGVLFRRYPNGWSEPGADPDHPQHQYATWAQINDMGEVTRLMPATDVVDAGIVKELTEALRANAEAWHGEFCTGSFETCPRCASDVALLARAEGATGGGR